MKKIVIALGLLTVAGAVNTTTAQTKKDKKAPAKQQATTTGFISIGGGTDYKIVEDKPGTTFPKIGDYVEVALTMSVDDSIVFDTYTAMEGKPAPLVIQEVAFKGDFMEALKFINEGDSAIIRLTTDSVLAVPNTPSAPWMKRGVDQKISYNLRMVTFKTKEQKEREDQAQAANQLKIDEKIITDYLAAKKIKATRTTSGLYYKLDNPGTGEAAKTGQRVSVNYTGMLINGEKFDSNVDPDFQHVMPFKFNLGQGQVIKGWDEGIALLKVGGKGTLYIPSNLAYGPRQQGPKIGPNSVLIFDVELLDVVSGIGE